MSRQRRRSQPKPDAALVQKLDALTTQMAELTRRMSPADAARGTPLPAHLVNPPRQQRTPQLDQVAVKGDAAMGVPSQQLMNDMLKNQAPQAGAVGIYAPGAPLQVVPGIESPYGPRIWDFPYGYNIAALPRSTEATAFQELRDLSDLYYGIRLCQRVWFDVINRLELKISFEPGVIPDGESETDAKWKKLTQPVRDFLAYPDGQNSLSDWLIMSVSDVQELGQSIIFKNRNKKGEIIALDVVDAALVKPLLDQRGRLPKPPYPAFEQFIKGIPAGLYVGDTDVTQEWTSSQMHLIREMARTNSVYSRSRVEDILLIINQALRKQNLDLTRYTDGSTPEGMVFVDPSYAEGSPEEWGEVERSLNGVYAGNDRMRARLKIMPPGLKDYTNTRSPDPQIDFDMWLLKITCGSFGVTMAEIGITDDVNRSTGDSQENVIYRRVVQPLAVRYAQFLTEVVKERFDKRMRVEWGGIEEQEDRLAKAQELDILVKNGSISPSRAAREMGYEVDTEVPAFVLFNGGPTAAIVMDDLDALRKSQLESFQTQTEQAKAGLKNTQLQAEQLQMVIKQQQQGGQQQGEDQGGEGQGQGEGNEPEPNGPGGNSDSGNEQQGEQESEGEASPEDEGEPGGNEDQDQGASEQPGESEGEEPGPDDEAAREVDRLIAQAKARQSKGKQQRMQVADDDASAEWRRYRDVALRAVKRQQSVPPFTSDVLPSNLHTYAAEALQRATTPDDVRQVFADVRAMEQAEHVRAWAEHEIVRGANGRIIGNIYPDGSFHAVGEGHERTANDHEHAAIQAKSRLDQAEANYAAARRVAFAAADVATKASKRKRGGGNLDEPRRGVSDEEYRRLVANRDALREAWNKAYLPVYEAQRAFDEARVRTFQHRLLAERPNGATPRYHPDLMQLERLATTPEIENWLRQAFPETQFHLDMMDAGLAKEIARELGELGRTYPEIMATLHGVATHSGTLLHKADPYFVKAADRFDRAAVAQVVEHLQDGESRSVMVFSDLHRYPQRIAEMVQESARFSQNGRTWMVRDDTTGTTRHEFGHVVENFLTHHAGEYGYRAYDFVSAYHYEPSSSISLYSNDNKHERFAEGFSAGKYGSDSQKHDPYVEEIMSLLTPFEVGGAS